MKSHSFLNKEQLDKELLILFSKSPEKGKVKTRLIPKLGEDRAFELYKKLLKQTLENCFPKQVKVNRDCQVYLKGDLQNIFIKDQSKTFPFIVKEQQGKHLGESLSHAFVTAFMNFEQVVLIGGDCVSINKAHIEEAFDNLQHSDCVLAPAEDGGFVLVGFKKQAFITAIFDDIDWGCSAVYKQFVENLRAHQVTFSCLETLWDIDEYEDLLRLKNIPLFDDFT